jgi:hypothetical protein
MRKFCEDVLKFLKSEYNDSYDFNIEYTAALDHDNDSVKLIIKMCQSYVIKLDEAAMFFVYGWYKAGEHIEERNQYRWQKELIDMIEGS